MNSAGFSRGRVGRRSSKAPFYLEDRKLAVPALHRTFGVEEASARDRSPTRLLHPNENEILVSAGITGYEGLAGETFLKRNPATKTAAPIPRIVNPKVSASSGVTLISCHFAEFSVVTPNSVR